MRETDDPWSDGLMSAVGRAAEFLPPLPRDSRSRSIPNRRGLIVSVGLWVVLLAILVSAVPSGWHRDETYDEAALREWIEECRIARSTLPELVREYLGAAEPQSPKAAALPVMAQEVRDQLRCMAVPTKMYQGQLPLFPTIYRLELRFQAPSASLGPIVWESRIPRAAENRQVRRLSYGIAGPGRALATLFVDYQLHAYNRRQQEEQTSAARLRWVSGLTAAALALVFLWIYLAQRRQRERERKRLMAQQEMEHAQRTALENELKRKEAERKHAEVERKLLEQQLATQAAEGRALEMKSQLYASIGIMAGSYAHNIKNLLVRPTDLVRRCEEQDGLSADQSEMLREVRETLGTVTERLQQILQTVRRDPARSEMSRFDLGALVEQVARSWEQLALEKWKLQLKQNLADGALWIRGDASHVQQAIENILFNARDATFEMRSHLREEARRIDEGLVSERRQALIAAAAWRGHVLLSAHRDGESVVLEVKDNGIGMTEEVRQRCVETHFTTKRHNAIYEGNSTGMGLGLSFVASIMEHHGGKMEIESEPLRGTLFRLRFPNADIAEEKSAGE